MNPASLHDPLAWARDGAR